MSATEQHTSDNENELFDLLVDNELDEQRRGRLLSGLDKRPDGWRKCALAFLEAQSFGKEFSFLLRAPATDETASAEVTRPSQSAAGNMPTTPGRPWSRKNAATLTAMAASFLLAMGIGVVIENRGPSHVANSREAPFGSIVNVNPPLGRTPATVPVNNRRGATPSSPVQMVTLSSSQSGDRGIRLPAVQRDELDEKWLRDVPPAMPDEVLRAFKRTGHHVEQSRQLIPLKMKDGRRLVVPVDQVDVHYVGDSAL